MTYHKNTRTTGKFLNLRKLTFGAAYPLSLAKELPLLPPTKCLGYLFAPIKYNRQQNSVDMLKVFP